MSFIDNHCPECKETSYRVYKKYADYNGLRGGGRNSFNDAEIRRFCNQFS